MTLHASLHRWTLAALLVATGATTFAPMAHADRGDHGDRGWQRYKHEERGAWGHRDRGDWNHGGWSRGNWGGRVVLRDHDHGGAGPVFAGVIGGMILGSVLSSHAHPVVVREQVCAPPPVVIHDRYYEDDRSQQADPRDGYQAPAPVRERSYEQPGRVYRYEDGNGERWWDTLDECTDAARGNRGPHVIHVVDDQTNQVVKTLYWQRDHWISDQDRDGSDD